MTMISVPKKEALQILNGLKALADYYELLGESAFADWCNRKIGEDVSMMRKSRHYSKLAADLKKRIEAGL